MKPRRIDDDEIELEMGDLASGFFGKVVRGLMQDKKRPHDLQHYLVVVKVSKKPNLAAQMEEYEALRQVPAHPNLLALVGYMVHAQTELRLVFPFVSGGSLERVITLDPTWGCADLGRIIKGTLELLCGLEALALVMFVHRDSTCLASSMCVVYSFVDCVIFTSQSRSPVAARNVVLTADGVWVLLDYGMAKEMYTGQSGDTYYRQSGNSLIPIRWYDAHCILFLLSLLYSIMA
jgi:serine/threonine protein kinase